MNGDNSEKFDMDPERNLIVNYLPRSITESDLKELFSSVSVPTKCRLMRNPVTGESLTYAYVEFNTAQATAEVIQRFNGMNLQDKKIKVSYAKKSSSSQSSSQAIKDTNVYIASLPTWISEPKLLELFSPFGEVVTHKLLTNPDGSSKGVGFVRYSTNAEAERAIERMHGSNLPDSGTPLTVKLAIPPASKTNTAGIVQIIGRNANSSLRFNPIAASNQLPLTQVIPVAAPPMPNTVEILNQKVALTQQGIAAVPAAAAAATAAHQVGLEGQLAVAAAHQQQQQGQVSSVYVYGLDADHTELTLYELFAPFGGILNVRLMRDKSKPNQPCKGYGFVNFRKYDEAYTAVLTMNNRILEKKVLQVKFKSNT